MGQFGTGANRKAITSDFEFANGTLPLRGTADSEASQQSTTGPSGSPPTTLKTITLRAPVLNKDGTFLRVVVWGNITGTADDKTLTIQFDDGTTSYDVAFSFGPSGAGVANDGRFFLEIDAIIEKTSPVVLYLHAMSTVEPTTGNHQIGQSYGATPNGFDLTVDWDINFIADIVGADTVNVKGMQVYAMQPYPQNELT